MSLLPISINGLSNDHSSVRLSFLGGRLLFSHVKSISYDDSLTPSENAGTHPIPLPTGLGVYKANCSITVVKDAWDNILNQIPDGYGALVFPITVTYIRGLTPTVDRLIDCRIIGPKNSSSQGQGGLDIELSIYVRYILRNGKCLAPIDADVTPIVLAF